MDALAITDHGVMYAAVDFYLAAKNAGIKPIIGCEVYVAPGSRHGRQPKVDTSPQHLILLARDEKGYRNLLQLATKAQLEGFYYKPRVDKELLAQHKEGLIALTACGSGEIPRQILAGDLQGARKTALWFKELYGDGNFYLELQRHDIPELQTINRELVTISRELDIPLVATNDVHYVLPSDAYGQEILLCIQTNTTMDDPKRMRMQGETFYLRSAEEMAQLFEDVPEAIANTRAIAERCNLKLDSSRTHLPHFGVPAGYTPYTYLEKLCRDGLKRRYERITPEIEERLQYELSVIEQTGFATYILIVADFVAHARANGILYGARGSAAGSMVCHCLGISDVDPIRNKLVFERFLNIERIEMPDIDMDFADIRRDEMIAYASQKYGRDHVAQIITFGTLGAKAAVRDVGRALGIPYGEVDRVAKLIPSLPLGMTIERALEDNRELRGLYESDDLVKKVLDSAKSVEGVSRHASTHAAGVVISRDPLTHHVPLQRASKGEEGVMTQYTMNTLAKIGLLKMDFLGLTNLTMLGRTLELIRQTRGIEIDLQNIPKDDAKVFEMLGAGETTNVFQLEGGGMRSYIKQLKPTSIDDLAAMVALYRPGPMAHIPKFIESKAGTRPIEYVHPALEPILSDTYGVIVYQEQVLGIVQAIAGYSLGQADILRKAMGKKIAEEMKKQRGNFIAGAKKNGIGQEDASKIFDVIEPFAGYAFNRAHAYCYADLAYQTAYMKANYPVEYMVAVLSTAMGNTDKVASSIAESRRMGITLLPPDINRSALGFTIEGNHIGRGIRMGLGAIKNLGEGAIEAIIAVRQQDGPFKSVDDFSQRVDLRLVNKRALESLIKAGAMDCLGRRGQLLAVLDRIVSLSQQSQRAAQSGQVSLFDFMIGETETVSIKVPDAADVPLKDQLAWEKELLGVYVSEHPLQRVTREIDELVTMRCDEIAEESAGEKVSIGGIITSVRRLVTKKRETMVAAVIEDMHGSIEVVAFPKTYGRTQEVWAEDNIVVVEGKVDTRGDRLQIICDSASIYVPRGAAQPAVDGGATKAPAVTGTASGNGQVFGKGEAPSAVVDDSSTEPRNGHSPQHDGSKTQKRYRLCLTIQRQEDDAEDLRLLQNVFAALSRHNKGEDQVDLCIAADGCGRVELELPHARVRYCRQLHQELNDLLGQNGIAIESCQ